MFFIIIKYFVKEKNFTLLLSYHNYIDELLFYQNKLYILQIIVLIYKL